MSLGHLFAILAVYLFAIARVVRFVNHDKLLDWLYTAIESRVRDAGRSDAERDRWAVFSDFLACPWCVSIWVFAGSAWIPLYFPDNVVVRYVGIVLAGSYLVSLAAPLTAASAREYEPTQSA